MREIEIINVNKTKVNTFMFLLCIIIKTISFLTSRNGYISCCHVFKAGQQTKDKRSIKPITE